MAIRLINTRWLQLQLDTLDGNYHGPKFTPELEAVARAILDATIRHNCAIIGKPYHPEQYDEFDYARAYDHAQAALDALRPYRDAEIKAAVEAERDECAQKAEWHGRNVSNEMIGQACSRNIAAALRNREPGA